MESILDPNGLTAPDYCGCILSGDFSVELKRRVAEYIDHYRVFEDTGGAAILYIAAWPGKWGFASIKLKGSKWPGSFMIWAKYPFRPRF